jgi:hypothetical protein
MVNPALIAAPEGVVSSAKRAHEWLDAVALGQVRYDLPLGDQVFAAPVATTRMYPDPWVSMDDRIFRGLQHL